MESVGINRIRYRKRFGVNEPNNQIESQFSFNAESIPLASCMVKKYVIFGSRFFTWTINAFAGLLSDIVLNDNLQSIIRGDRNVQKAQRAFASGGWN